MRVRDHRRTQPNRTAAAASTCCPISAVAGVRGATTFAQTRLRRCLPGRNRIGGCGAGAMRNNRQDGRGPSSCSRLPSSDLGAPGRRRADRRKGTTGRPVRTDRVSFCAHTAGGHTEALFFKKIWKHAGRTARVLEERAWPSGEASRSGPLLRRGYGCPLDDDCVLMNASPRRKRKAVRTKTVEQD